MGGLSINNIEIRCSSCFHMFSMKIKPEFPITNLCKVCNCTTTETEINTFLTEFKKNKKFTISCSNCNKQNQKDSLYCEGCKKIICLNCLKNTHKDDEEMKNHRCIYIDRLDFFCVYHPTEHFCAYCKTCKLNLCTKCIQENIHEKHKLFYFNKSYDEKKMKEFLKKAIKGAEGKIEYNKVICNMICKKINKIDIKKMKIFHEFNESVNKNILETINIFYEMYEASKNKNYALISNLIDNIDFNLEKIKFDKNTSEDKDMQELIDYFKSDFILKVKIKKDSNKNLDEKIYSDDKEKENNANETGDINQRADKDKDNLEKKLDENTENTEKIENKKKDGEYKEDEKKEVEIENKVDEKKEEEKKEEEKKEDEKKEEEKKEEEKKEDEKKEEVKKEEEKKEEEKKEEEKKEEKKRGGTGHVKSFKEMTALLSNKISSQGGFRKSASNIPASNKNNDIIHEPKGNPEDVINIIQNQKIIKKANKKPKKINFDN